VSHASQLRWRLFFRLAYRFLRLVDPLVRLAWRGGFPGLGRVVDLQTTGRRSGRRRRTLVTELTFEGRRYVGHPNGQTAWMRNLDAAADATVLRQNGAPQTVLAVRLEPGLERDGVIRATWSQQPFPADTVYWLARDHVFAVGIYYRLEERLLVERRREAAPVAG
jgi:hypothetical protein